MLRLRLKRGLWQKRFSAAGSRRTTALPTQNRRRRAWICSGSRLKLQSTKSKEVGMSRELRDKRAGLLKEARTLVEKAESEKRALIAEEQQRYDALMAEVTDLTATVQRLDLLAEQERALADTGAHRPEPETRGGD